MAKIVQCGEFVGPGEKRTAQYFERYLPASWVVICNKELVSAPNRPTRELDFVILADNTVFLIEEKSWRGNIHGNENAWITANRESVPSPLNNVDRLARTLAGMLRAKVPGLKAADHRFVFGIVVLSSNDADPVIQDPRARSQLLHLHGSEQTLADCDARDVSHQSIAVFRKSILDALTVFPNRPRIPRQIGDYTILEQLPSQATLRCFRAEHTSKAQRVLKVAVKPDTLDAVAAQKQYDLITRESEALARLASLNCVPNVDPFFSWDADQFLVIPIHPVPGCSLRAARATTSPSSEQVLSVSNAAFTALAKIHEAGVIHRAITPDRVFLDGSNLYFTDFLIARVPDANTINVHAKDLDPDSVYRAPECRVDLGLAEATSDVYSLAASLGFWATGIEPSVEDDGSSSTANLPSAFTSDQPGNLSAILHACLHHDERKRPTAKHVASCLAASCEPEQLLADGDRYEVREKLGEGGFATVWHVYDRVLARDCALKILRPEHIADDGTISRFIHEARTLAKIDHPQIVRVYDVATPAVGHPRIIMEYVEGETLHATVLRDGPLFPVDALMLIQEILSAVGTIHVAHIVHRDVTPTNIMRTSKGIKLLDFGISAMLDRTHLTKTVGTAGTPRYMAPEQFDGHSSYQSDIYAVGRILYFLIMGNDPPVNKLPAWPSQLQSIGDLYDRATRPEESERFSSAEEFASAAAATIAGLPEDDVVQARTALSDDSPWSIASGDPSHATDKQAVETIAENRTKGFWSSVTGKTIRWLLFLPVGLALCTLCEFVIAFVLVWLYGHDLRKFIRDLVSSLVWEFPLFLALGLLYVGSIWLAVKVIAPKVRVAVIIFAVSYYALNGFALIKLMSRAVHGLALAPLPLLKIVIMTIAGFTLTYVYKDTGS